MLQATAETTRNTANRSVNPAAQAPSIRQFPHERRQKRAATVCRSDTKRGASCRCCPPPYSGPERRAADVTGLDDIVLAVVMTCFNRTTLTSRCIESLKACELPNKIKFRVYLTDDGCTDDTAAKALELCPDAVISKGDGSLYWCGGMRLSMQAALADGADFVLWLNDDVVLDPGAINAAWQTYKSGSKSSIVIGSTVDPSTGTLNYGGLKPRGQWGVRTMSVIDPRIESQYSIVDPTKQAHCETMAGQFVLIPRAVALKVGQIEPLFTHWLGDVDYGYRARAKGVELRLIPQIIGSCASNPRQEQWRLPESSFTSYWRKVNSPKGLSMRERMIYYRRHAGLAWWIAWALPYINQLMLYPLLATKQKNSGL